MADAGIRCATLQAGVPAARSRWQRIFSVLLKLGREGIRCADAMNVRANARTRGVPRIRRCASACSAGQPSRRGPGAILIDLQLNARPASCRSRPLRDGLRFAHATGSWSFPLLPDPAQGARETSAVVQYDEELRKISIAYARAVLHNPGHEQAVHCRAMPDHSAFVEGNSVNSTCRMTGRSKHTVLKLLADMGTACQTFHDEKVRGLACKRVQYDELGRSATRSKRTCRKKSRGASATATFGLGLRSARIPS